MNRTVYYLVLIAFVALMTQGFQCASSEMSTARKAYQAKNYDKAKESLLKELELHPENCEALIMLGKTSMRMNDFKGMADAYAKARACPGVKPSDVTEMSIDAFNAWVGFFNEGISKYNDFVTNKQDIDLRAAVVALQGAMTVKPEYSEPLNLMGQLHELTGDTNTAMTTYLAWWKLEEAGFNIMKTKQLSLGSARQEVLKTLGTPVQQKLDTATNELVYKDKFDVGGRDLYIFSTQTGSTDAVVTGWTYNLPSSIAEAEKWRARNVSLAPVKAMAFTYYARGRNEDALGLCNVVQAAKPSDVELIPMRTQLLQQLGKSDEALMEIKRLVDADAKNVTTRLQYAALLMQLERTDEAMVQYTIILENDASNTTALFNLAAAFKNKASLLQRAEQEKKDKDKNYKINESYLDDLKTSADYFEHLRKSPQYADNLTVLDQLANIYEVRKERAKVKAIIMELEALEMKYQTNKEYYRVMEGVYARNNMLDKMKEATAKAQQLK